MQELFIQYFKNVYGNDIDIKIINDSDDYDYYISIDPKELELNHIRGYYYKDRFYNDTHEDEINKNFEAFVRKIKIKNLLK